MAYVRVKWLCGAGKNIKLFNYIYLSKKEQKILDEFKRTIQRYYIKHTNHLRIGILKKMIEKQRGKMIESSRVFKYVFLLTVLQNGNRRKSFIRLESKIKRNDKKYKVYKYVRLN